MEWNGDENRGFEEDGGKKQEAGRREFNFEDTTKYFGFGRDVCNHEN